MSTCSDPDRPDTDDENSQRSYSNASSPSASLQAPNYVRNLIIRLLWLFPSYVSIFNFTPSYKDHPQYLYFISLWPSCHLQEHGHNISSSESRDRNFVSEAKVCPALHHRLALSLSFTLMFEINLPLSSIKSWVFIFRNIHLYDHLMNVNWGTKLKRDPLTLTNFLIYLFK